MPVRLQTEDEPPNHGRIILATMDWIWNSWKADRKTVTAKMGMEEGLPDRGCRSMYGRAGLGLAEVSLAARRILWR
jgi:hypothetical protein